MTEEQKLPHWVDAAGHLLNAAKVRANAGPEWWDHYCREIACCLDDSECEQLAEMADALAEQLRDVPVKRRANRLVNAICDGVASILK